MNSVRLFKKITALGLTCVFASSYAHAQVSNYSASNANALATCQQNKSCTSAQKAEIKQNERDAKASVAQGQTAGYCNGSGCSKSSMNQALSQQQQAVANENAQAYQNGVNTANGGAMTAPTYSTNDAANGSGTSASSGSKGKIVMIASAGAAVATATVLKAPCKSIVSSAWACPLMAVALVQVGASLLSSKGAGASRDALVGGDGYGSGGTNGTSPTTLNGGITGSNGSQNSELSLAEQQAGALAMEAAELQKTVNQAGYQASADGSTVTGPNGKKVSTSTFSSPNSMSSAGFSDSQISAMDSTMEAANLAANDKFKKIAGNLTNDTGGGRGSGSGSENGGSGGGGSGYADYDPNGLMGKNSKLKGNAVAGMSKKFGSDNIGVAGDNIFEMITRRYQARDKENNFIVDKTAPR